MQRFISLTLRLSCSKSDMKLTQSIGILLDFYVIMKLTFSTHGSKSVINRSENERFFKKCFLSFLFSDSTLVVMLVNHVVRSVHCRFATLEILSLKPFPQKLQEDVRFITGHQNTCGSRPTYYSATICMCFTS